MTSEDCVYLLVGIIAVAGVFILMWVFPAPV